MHPTAPLGCRETQWPKALAESAALGAALSTLPSNPLAEDRTRIQRNRLRDRKPSSPTDLLSPHVQQQVGGRQAKDHSVYAERAGLGHELHSLK